MTQSGEAMQWTSTLSTRASLETAVNEVVAQAQRSLTMAPDLGFVFISAAFASEFSRLLPLLQDRLSVPTLVGCSGGGVVGWADGDDPTEVENSPALSLCLAHLPQVHCHAFHLSADDLPDLDSPPDAWIQAIGVEPEVNPQFVLMADPYSPGINDLLQGLDFAYPQAIKVGGLAGIGSFNKSSGLFCQGRYYDDGIVGVALSGNIMLDAIVAQGCRPIGQPYRVAEGERNVVLKLDDGNESVRPAMEILQELFQGLSEADRKLAQHSLFIGVEQSGFKPTLGPGDFLIRNLIGVDPRLGAIAIGDRVRPGQRVQFHLRDAATSAEDLELLLQRYPLTALPGEPTTAGALMFSCMGRGKELYETPSFDAHLFNRYLQQVPLSGFFCNGEIGPIGGTTFLHGYTSVFAICRQPD